MSKISRRDFLAATGISAVAMLAGCSGGEKETSASGRAKKPNLDPKILAVASGTDPAKLTRAAVNALGGMSKLVKKGDMVAIKVNASWNRPADAAATTNPAVVAEVVKMCKEAGAGKILVVDHAIDRPSEAVWGLCGIKAATEAAGASVLAADNESDFRTVSIPNGKVLKSDTCIKDVLKADVFINVPIAKTHSATRLTLGMKNLMGCNWDRGLWHSSSSLDQCIADYVTAVRPDLTIMDANRVLLTNGPKGPGETKDLGKVIAGIDPVAVDSYGATLFDIKPSDIGYIRLASEMGVGEMDLAKVSIKNV